MGSKPSRVRLGATRDWSSLDETQSSTMPFFRKQSSEAKKRLQHQLYLARESPEATFDISKCEISEVPPGVFSLCKVLQKEVLLLHTNWLSSIKAGGSLKDLKALTVLDLHDNEISSLPDEIGYMENLQVLNVENNKLKYIPRTIDHCLKLQTINVTGNKMKALPETLCSLRQLQTLEMSCNPQLSQLPRMLCQVRSIETIVLDPENFTYPAPDVCSKGTEAIMMFLCQECSIEYIAPADYTPSMAITTQAKNLNNMQKDHIDNTVNVLEYEMLKEKKRQELLRLEQQMEEENIMQSKLAAQAAANKKHLISFVALDQKRFDKDINVLQKSKEKERKQLIHSLSKAEKNVTEMVNELIKMNETARRTEELLERMEQDRIEAEQWFIVRQEEIENLRKQEVLANMEETLEEYHRFNQMVEGFLVGRDENIRLVQEAENDVEEKLEAVLNLKKDDQEALIKQLVDEESLQKEAFSALQLQKDIKHSRLSSQIDLIEQELAQLSMLEVEQRSMRSDMTFDILEDKRHCLAELLVQLLTERDKRTIELRKRLGEMEAQRQEDQDDYWLIQYQRLMDRKPQSLIDQERMLEYAVCDILEAAGASDHIPTFARHRITIETMSVMSDSDLQSIGIHEVGMRKNIVVEIGRQKVKREQERAIAKLKGIVEEDNDSKWLVRPPGPPSSSGSLTPSAPEAPLLSTQTSLPSIPSAPSSYPSVPSSFPSVPSSYQPTSPGTTPTISRDVSPLLTPQLSPSHDVTARGINSECVVCMERQSVMLFLNCGHVCCCYMCAEPLSECPLCRSPIAQRIRLSIEI